MYKFININKIVFLLLLPIICFLCFTGCGTTEINAIDYITVSFEGVNGEGTASYEIDFSEFEKVYDSKSSPSAAITDVMMIEEAIECTLDKTENLSNGDKVLAKLEVDEDTLEKYDCEISGKREKTFIVEGLEENEEDDNNYESEYANWEAIDPFEGLEVQFDGASPYLNIGFNNSKCRREVQDYIDFVCDDETCANGDVITVRAEYNINDFESLGLEVEFDEKTYEVSGQAEYVNDISKIDTTVLDKEIQEYMDAHYLDVSGSFGSVDYIMGAYVFDGSGFGKLMKSKLEETYLCVRKPNKLNKDEDYNYYYKIYNNTYKLKGGDIGTHKINVYSCIYVKNIISYPDGTIKYEPKLEHNASKSREDAFYEGISVKKEDFNVSKVQ